MSEPIADSVRSLLDGHVVLNRELAWRNHYPCIDILSSVSRLMNELVPDEHRDRTGKIREWISTYNKAEDMINIGAYVKGSNPRIDQAMLKNDAVNAFLRQRSSEQICLEDALTGVEEITRD